MSRGEYFNVLLDPANANPFSVAFAGMGRRYKEAGAYTTLSVYNSGYNICPPNQANQ